VFVATGTSLQMIYQLGVTLISVFILHVTRPYIKRGDLYLALLAQWVIFAISFISLLLKLDSLNPTPVFDKNSLQTLLLFLFLSVPILAGVQILYSIALSEGTSSLIGRMANNLEKVGLRSKRQLPVDQDEGEDEQIAVNADMKSYDRFLAQFKQDATVLEAFFLEAMRDKHANEQLTREKQHMELELMELGKRVMELEKEEELLAMGGRGSIVMPTARRSTAGVPGTGRGRQSVVGFLFGRGGLGPEEERKPDEGFGGLSAVAAKEMEELEKGP
jgi:hypothetical protein